MKCVILQPSYIPWRGYFHQVYKSDLFIFFDDVQYDKHGWRNRNRIKTPNGSRWLTIPIHSHGTLSQHTLIQDILICWDKAWNDHHWEIIQLAYRNAPYFLQYARLLEAAYQKRMEHLADFTIDLTIDLAKEIGISNTRFLRSSSLEGITGIKTERLINILTRIGATHYISGPSARDYIEEEKFQEAGITLEYMQYDYPPYPQLYPPYDPNISIIDLLFMTGPQAIQYILQ